MRTDLQHILDQTVALVGQVGWFILGEKEKITAAQVDHKSLNSLVTYVDKHAERRLVEGLSSILPEAVFITEEDTIVNKEGDLRWIIDPLDGTTNFIHKLPCYSISVALEMEGELVLGVVNDIEHETIFSARKGGGAFAGEARMTVSSTPSLGDSLLATGFPYYSFKKLDPYIDYTKALMGASRGLRRFGSAAIDLAYTAAGRFDGFYEYGLNIWDVAAGIVLIREAGGVVSSFEGYGDFIERQTIVAGNPVVHGELVELMKDYF